MNRCWLLAMGVCGRLGLAVRPFGLAIALAGLVVLQAGCVLPARGTPVFVDLSASDDLWSGEGMLLETSADGSRCRVAVRDRALIVHKWWVACHSVHPRRGT